MSHSSFLIRPPNTLSASSGQTQSVSAPAQHSHSGGASFAAVMADKSAAHKQEDAASAQASRVAGKGNGGQTSAALRADMRRSHAGWSPTGIPLAGNRNSASPRPAYVLGEGASPGFALKSGDFIHIQAKAGGVKKTTEQDKKTPPPERGGIGELSARFESGGDGIAAIGYDRTGGTSYGKYQIAARVGGMKDFLKFLDTRGPDIAARLRGAGPADTGSRKGEMPDLWRAIAREEPERFERLQEQYIRESHFKPAMAAIAARTRLKEENMSSAMREVVWSTAVQHGPTGAARLFDKADDMCGKETGAAYERKLINNVYALRAGQFGSSDSAVQASVSRRFVQEKMLALNMLDAGNGTSNLA